MQQTIFIVEQTFSLKSAVQRKEAIQKKIEQYIKNKVETLSCS